MATWDTWQGDSWIDPETNQRFMYDPEQMRTRSVDEYNGERQQAAEGLAKTNAYFSSNPQAFQKLTPEQTDYIKNFHGSADDLTKYYGSINPNLSNLYGNGLASNGADMWWTPQQGPRHTDNGGPLSAGSLLTGGLDVGEQGQSDWNEMRTGLGIMALPFVGAGITAGLGAAGAGAGAAGAGGTEAGAGALYAGETASGVGTGAGLGGTGGGATGMGVAEGGVLSGSTGSASLIGGAGSDTAGASAGTTGAFDTAGSQGVFDSAGNGLYESPSVLQYAQGLAAQYGITPASALSFIKSNAGLFGGLLGLGAGAVGGGAKPAGTTTTTQDLPDWLKPYAQGNVAQGSNILSQLPSSAPLLSASQTEAMKTINGDYLNPSSNPYFASSVNDALGLAKSQFAGMYGGQAGSNINNSGFQEGLTRTLGQLATNAYSTNYQNERNRQATATFGAPQFASQSAAAPFAGNQAFSGLFPNVSSTSVPYFQNNLGNMFSGAVGGAVLGKAVG